jgi:small neutral amino acid transporter SnatA (MarC family)
VKTHRIIILACSAVAIFFVGSALLGREILAFFNVGLDGFRLSVTLSRGPLQSREKQLERKVHRSRSSAPTFTPVGLPPLIL